MMRKVAAAKGSSAGTMMAVKLRQRPRPKLDPISISSRSSANRPSRRLTIANGSSTTEIENTTVADDTPNQITASRVQPMPEKALRNGLRRW